MPGMDQPLVPPIHPDDDDDVVVALETARLEEERGAAQAAATWVQKAASAARKQGRPNRAGELSRAQAMLGLRAGRTTTTAPPPPPMDDDFSEKTIVDRIQSLSARSDEPSSNAESSVSSEPAAVLPEGALRFPMRVAVRTLSDGRLDVRIFADAQTLQPGEVEAFLVQSLSGPGR
jgi:hypothetical protein